MRTILLTSLMAFAMIPSRVFAGSCAVEADVVEIHGEVSPWLDTFVLHTEVHVRTAFGSPEAFCKPLLGQTFVIPLESDSQLMLSSVQLASQLQLEYTFRPNAEGESQPRWKLLGITVPSRVQGVRIATVPREDSK